MRSTEIYTLSLHDALPICNLLDYIIFAALIFYVLTIAGVFVLRRTRPEAERPYRALGYPILPALYIVGATAIMLVLLAYRVQTTWPGLLIVISGVPIYFLWKFLGKKSPAARLSSAILIRNTTKQFHSMNLLR